ncbi:MAG: HAMP domain-containing histidine kinase [Desulfosarcina sp.]|nr:HAMP domain-containing histidine kinase [Desulfobacterales bacterium]
MSSEINIIGESGLQFFGKISASISHEINNVLAIINENAGLLDDFTIMADKGMPLDPNRLKNVASKILVQIRRADEIVRNMNTFSHTIDQIKADLDLRETVEFVVTLAHRFASMRGITIKIKPPENIVTISTAAFFLENLIWLCLDFAMNVTGSAKTLSLIIGKTESGGRICFAGLEGLTSELADTFPSDRETALLGMLKAELTVSAEQKELILYLQAS